jgi:nicotinate-nucleotide adenylyltransferase
LYGGTFDPPHNAHLKLAQLSAEKLALDAVYFIPAAHHPFKGISQISSVSIRIEMLEKALEKYALFRISRIECDRSDISYTIDTLRNFMEYEKTGDAQLYFILGTDNFDEFHMWKNPDEIFDLATIVALRRPGSEKSTVLKKYQEHIILLDLPLLNISSTQIRNKIRRGEDYSDLVPPGIPEIVQRYNLYR